MHQRVNVIRWMLGSRGTVSRIVLLQTVPGYVDAFAKYPNEVSTCPGDPQPLELGVSHQIHVQNVVGSWSSHETLKCNVVCHVILSRCKLMTPRHVAPERAQWGIYLVVV